MAIARQVFAFFVRDKIAAMSDPITWGYALAGLFVLGLAICYDFNAPHIIGKLKANGAEVILAPFNDSGFGVIFHRMHSHYSILRALEYNVPIIVANEDGISQIVDRDGRVHASLGIGEQGVITASVSLDQSPSYYLLAGRWAEYALLLALALQLGGQARRSRAAGGSR